VSIIYVPLPAAMVLAAFFYWDLVLAVRLGRHDGLDTPAVRMLHDDHPVKALWALDTLAPTSRPNRRSRSGRLARSMREGSRISRKQGNSEGQRHAEAEPFSRGSRAGGPGLCWSTRPSSVLVNDHRLDCCGAASTAPGNWG
jgi:nitrogen fixation-related uncharacterized protein